MFISAIGITDLLLAVSPIVGWVTFSLLVAGVVFFFATTVLPIFSLDAPFRSPLSDFIIHFIGFMKKHIHLPQTLRRRPKAGDAETGLEDQVGRHEVGACEASEIVRTRIDLDFHILCHLLENADRSTERWLLDQCFEKLPTLALLEQKHPELILKRDTLVYIYIFLAKGCVISQEQTKRLNPNRRQRAVRLCEFMAWFLSLPRSETIQGRLVQRLFHQDGFDALELPKVLAEDSSSVESLIPPLTALARLKHLKSHTVDAIACTACEEASRELKDLTTGTRSAARNQVVQVVTSFVIMHSVCPIFHHAFAVDEKAGLEKASAPSICTASLEILRRSLANLSFTDKKEVEEWIKLVKRWSNGVDPLIRTQWFDKLLEIFNGVPIMVIPTLAVDDGTTPSPLQPTGSSPPSEPLVDSDSDTDPHRQARDQEAPGLDISTPEIHTVPLPSTNIPRDLPKPSSLPAYLGNVPQTPQVPPQSQSYRENLHPSSENLRWRENQRRANISRNTPYPDTQPPPVRPVYPAESSRHFKVDWGANKERPIWSYYVEKGQHSDADFVRDAESTVDSLLIFWETKITREQAGLFCAVVTAFISQTYPMLKADPVDILNSIFQEMQKPGHAPYTPFVVPFYATRVNCFLFAGLFVSMLVALFSILVKQWTRRYQRDLAGISSPHLRARIRHFRHNGVKKWRLFEIVGCLSILMHFAMFVSAIGIVDLLLATAPLVGWVALSMFITGVLFFLITALLPLFALDAPFRSPLSDFIVGFIKTTKRFVRLPRRLRSQQKESVIEDGLEDQVGKMAMGTCETSDIVRSRIDLDLDILCHLLETADKSTERWFLDLCFEKLPNLALLGQQYPKLIVEKDTLIDTYIFLAKGCITIQGTEKKLNPNRRQRAVHLCKFMGWFLSLPQQEKTRARLQQRLLLGFKPLELPQILVANPQAESFVPAVTAMARLEHLFDKESSSDECRVCKKATARLQSRNFATTNVHDELSQVVTSFIITHSDCLAFHAITGYQERITRARSCAESLTIFERFLARFPHAECKKTGEWMQLVRRRREGCHPHLQTVWFDKLLTIIGDVNVSGVNPVSSSSIISQPATTSYLPGDRSSQRNTFSALPPYIRDPPPPFSPPPLPKSRGI
ncbi:hypothetical protein FRC17_009941 [Serendipita sp. 399]|nr:hypothetical protein FRC17_009941 [Serendipita sp. 399]